MVGIARSATAWPWGKSGVWAGVQPKTGVNTNPFLRHLTLAHMLLRRLQWKEVREDNWWNGQA